MADRKINEGFTEFADTTKPYNQPWGMIGRFYRKFFAREVEDVKDDQYVDPITNRSISPPKPLQGDAVQNTDVVRIASEVGYEKTYYPVIPQLEYERKKRYKEKANGWRVMEF